MIITRCRDMVAKAVFKISVFALIVTLHFACGNKNKGETMLENQPERIFKPENVQNDEFKKMIDGLEWVDFKDYFYASENLVFSNKEPKALGNKQLNFHFGCKPSEDRIGIDFFDLDFSTYELDTESETFSIYPYSSAYEGFLLLPLRYSDETDDFISLFSFGQNGELLDCLTIYGSSSDTYSVKSLLNKQNQIEVKHLFNGQWYAKENKRLNESILEKFELTKDGKFNLISKSVK